MKDLQNMESRELRVVPFHGDEIVTFESGGARYVAMRRIVENMGLEWARQASKLQEQRAKFSCVHMPTTGGDGKTYQMLSMPVEKLPLWLASINSNKLPDPTVRDKVERYQAESAIALHDYWTKGVAVRGDMEGLVTGLDPNAARTIGGIVKAVVRSNVSEIISDALVVLLPEMVKAQLARGVAQRYGRTAGQIWRDHNLPTLRNGPQWLGNRLRQMGAALDGDARGEIGDRRSRLFDPDRASACMRHGLKQRAVLYVRERGGQGNIFELVGAKDREQYALCIPRTKKKDAK